MMKLIASASAATRLALIAAFAGFVALAGLWTLPPLDRDEARFAQATVQMLESGDYISIRLQEKERNKKPAGIYWLQATSVKAFSDVNNREIWAFRIPSVIGVIIAAMFTYLAAARLYDPYTGLLAGLLLASAPLVAAEATIAKTDGVLLALICIAQYAFIEIYARTQQNAPVIGTKKSGVRWPLLFWLAHGAGILVKGPIGPIVSLATGLGLLSGKPRLRWIGRMKPVLGVVILIAMVAPWALAINAATEGRFFTEAIGGDMLGKVGEVQESHAGPPGYHAVLLWVLFWPAAALIGPGLYHIWRDRRAWQARFLLAWLIPGWLVFELAATKLPHYVMPFYPALAIIAAHAALKDGAQQTTLRKLGAVTYGILGLVAAGLVAVLPIIFSAGPIAPICYTVSAIIATLAILIARLFWLGKALEGGVAASILAALYAWTLMTGVLPLLSELAVSPRISTALEKVERHPLKNDRPPVAIAGYSEPSAVFLLGTETVLTSGDDAARRLLRGDVSAAIIEERHSESFSKTISRHSIILNELKTIEGLNYSNGKDVSMTIYTLPETE